MLLNIRLKQIFSLLLLILLVISCSNNKPFDSVKWKQKGLDWQISEVREQMLDDLLKSDTLLNKNKAEVIELLGDPYHADSAMFKYLVIEKYERDIDPEYIQYLTIEFDSGGKSYMCLVIK